MVEVERSKEEERRSGRHVESEECAGLLGPHGGWVLARVGWGGRVRSDPQMAKRMSDLLGVSGWGAQSSEVISEDWNEKNGFG